ncbi:response regulator [Rheinheimera sp.]|uniref:response regulator n=1 Tax=Rheinheimera sp. TaxID=1869214 RepID=UPI00307D2DDD
MQKKILVVDDSKVSRLFVVNYWRDLRPDWIFVEAEGGEQAIQMAESQHFDVIVLDYNMPDIDGLHVAEKVKINQKKCFMALLTANIQRYIQDEAEQARLFYYRKPVTPDLIRQIAQDAEEYHNAIQ